LRSFLVGAAVTSWIAVYPARPRYGRKFSADQLRRAGIDERDLGSEFAELLRPERNGEISGIAWRPFE